MKGSYCRCQKCGQIWHVDFPEFNYPKSLPDVDPRAMKLIVAIVQRREAEDRIIMSPEAIAEVAKAVTADLKRAEAKDADPALAG